MRDFVPGLTVKHRPSVRRASTTASIQNQCGPIFERESRHPLIVRIVQIPTTPSLPVGLAPTCPYDLAARFVYFCFQLTPAQQEESLVIESLLRLDLLRLRRSLCFPLLFEELIELFVERRNFGQSLQASISETNDALRGRWYIRFPSDETCQFGGAKFSARSTMRKCCDGRIRSTRPFAPIIHNPLGSTLARSSSACRSNTGSVWDRTSNLRISSSSKLTCPSSTPVQPRGSQA